MLPGRPTLTTVNLSAGDPHALARFYAALLGWSVSVEEEHWVLVRDPAGGVGVSCQREDPYQRPVWPTVGGTQQMQVHLDIRVDDLDEGMRHAVACGATLAEVQPQDDVRVCLDPEGHPFCLWIET
jgi:predicted enzyme related to lactoylglutathione lyase